MEAWMKFNLILMNGFKIITLIEHIKGRCVMEELSREIKEERILH